MLSVVGRVYLLRAPLLATVGVCGFCYLAFFTGFNALLGNAFHISSFVGIFLVSSSAFLSAWVVVAAWRLVRLHGPERFLGTPAWPTSPNIGRGGIAWYALLFALVALPPIVGVLSKSTELGIVGKLICVFLALVVALIVRAFVLDECCAVWE